MENKTVVEKILDRVENRLEQFDEVLNPTLKVIARPVSVDHPIIQPKDIYDVCKNYHGIKRVAGGACIFTERSNEDDRKTIDLYFELNEYGIIYYRRVFSQELGIHDFTKNIKSLLTYATEVYNATDTSVNIEVVAELHNVFKVKLLPNLGISGSMHLSATPVCYDTEIFASTSKTYASLDIKEEEHQGAILEELTTQLLWSFNVPIDKGIIPQRIRDAISKTLQN